MRLTTLTLVAAMALANYRVVRFIIADTLIERLRMVVHAWLATGGPVRQKLFDLVSCPYCLSVWTGTGIFLATWAATPIELPLLVLAAVWGATMVVWRIVE